jgi:CDP-6-deoxy-D-xylo-4-hexulose-3-dehydrase
LIEDASEALGAKFAGRLAGTFGELASLDLGCNPLGNTGSIGALIVNDPALAGTVRSLRDGGREPQDNRYKFKFGDGSLPAGAISPCQVIYTKRSLNWRPAEIQAIAGLAHLRQADLGINTRRQLFKTLLQGIAPLKDSLFLPYWPDKGEPSYAACPMILLKGSRTQLIKLLRQAEFNPGPIAAGNILRQPAFKGMVYRAGSADFNGADQITDQGLLLPLHGRISAEAMAQLIEALTVFCQA